MRAREQTICRVGPVAQKESWGTALRSIHSTPREHRHGKPEVEGSSPSRPVIPTFDSQSTLNRTLFEGRLYCGQLLCSPQSVDNGADRENIIKVAPRRREPLVSLRHRGPAFVRLTHWLITPTGLPITKLLQEMDIKLDKNLF